MEIGHITEIPLKFTAVQFINRTSVNYQNRNFVIKNIIDKSFILFKIPVLIIIRCSFNELNCSKIQRNFSKMTDFHLFLNKNSVNFVLVFMKKIYHFFLNCALR